MYFEISRNFEVVGAHAAPCYNNQFIMLVLGTAVVHVIVDTIFELRDQLVNILSNGGFELRKCISNYPYEKIFQILGLQ